jgi:hypothetical protein
MLLARHPHVTLCVTRTLEERAGQDALLQSQTRSLTPARVSLSYLPRALLL